MCSLPYPRGGGDVVTWAEEQVLETRQIYMAWPYFYYCITYLSTYQLWDFFYKFKYKK